MLYTSDCRFHKKEQSDLNIIYQKNAFLFVGFPGVPLYNLISQWKKLLFQPDLSSRKLSGGRSGAVGDHILAAF